MNAKRFYGLHFSEGVSTFDSGLGYVSFEQAVALNKTMDGVPIYIDHIDIGDHNTDNQVGYVVKSFYNKEDGKFWCEFLIHNEKAIKLLESGHTLSNAYKFVPEDSDGHYHGIDYDFLVTEGEFDHLSIVDDPRYSESIVLTVDEFAEYNKTLNKETVTNSRSFKVFEKIKGLSKNKKVEATMKKKEAANNLAEIKDKIVPLKNGKYATVNELVDLIEEEDYMSRQASEDDYIILDGKKFTIKDLVEIIQDLTGAEEVEEVLDEPEVEIEVENEKDDEEEESENADDEEENEDEDEAEGKEKKNSKNSKKDKSIKTKNGFFSGLSKADRGSKSEEKEFSYSTNSQKLQAGSDFYGRK